MEIECLGVTGHRPDKLGGYDELATEELRVFAQQQLLKFKPRAVITGMALGWDQAVAQACVDFKVPFAAYVPFEGQDCKWPLRSRRKYDELLKQAREVKIICHGDYAIWKMHNRNQQIVHDCTFLLALYNGTQGGTQNCWEYAVNFGRERNNCWSDWIAFREQFRNPQEP